MFEYLFETSTDKSPMDKIGERFIEDSESVSDYEAKELFCELFGGLTPDHVDEYFDGKTFVPKESELA